MDISKKIIALREKNKLKQTDLANKLGMEQPNYSRLEKRGDKLTIEQLKDIAKALDISLQELLFDNDNIRNNKEEIKELKESITQLLEENKLLKKVISEQELNTQFLIEGYRGIARMFIHLFHTGERKEQELEALENLSKLELTKLVSQYREAFEKLETEEPQEPKKATEIKPHSTMKYRKMYKSRKTK